MLQSLDFHLLLLCRIIWTLEHIQMFCLPFLLQLSYSNEKNIFYQFLIPNYILRYILI
jgi:hypothetical protein